MTVRTPRGFVAIAILSIALSSTACQRTQDPATVSNTSHPVAATTLAPVGTVDDRYQSFNVEMLEVTGGKFWKPYGPQLEAILMQAKSAVAAASASDTPPGMDARLYEYRPPIDLGNVRLRKLASALAPAYVRVSGTWANTTYFPDSDGASDSACRLCWRADTCAVEGCFGFLPRRGREDSDVIGDRPRRPGRGGRMD